MSPLAGFLWVLVVVNGALLGFNLHNLKRTRARLREADELRAQAARALHRARWRIATETARRLDPRTAGGAPR